MGISFSDLLRQAVPLRTAMLQGQQQKAAQQEAKRFQDLKFGQEQEDREIGNSYKIAQTQALKEPKGQFDAERGVYVYPDGRSVQIPGVEPRPKRDPVAEAVAIAQGTKGIPTYGDLHPREPAEDKTLVQIQQPDGSVVYAPRSEAVGQNAPSPVARGSAAITKSVAENTTQMQVIDDALKELEAHPEAVGLKRGLADLVPFMGNIGDVVNQRQDPSGVMTRAGISDIGSLKIKDRSGAAVTISEFPRLAPFIPRVSDTPAAVKAKLARLKHFIKIETDLLAASAGRRPAASAPPTATSGSPGDIDLGAPSETQALWDAAVAKHGEAKVTKKYGPRPDK